MDDLAATRKWFANGPWDEHPDFPWDDWVNEVVAGDTGVGYREWALCNLELVGKVFRCKLNLGRPRHVSVLSLYMAKPMDDAEIVTCMRQACAGMTVEGNRPTALDFKEIQQALAKSDLDLLWFEAETTETIRGLRWHDNMDDDPED